MQFLQSRGMLLAAAIAAGGAGAQESTAAKELIPTGKLRVGIVFAPAASAFFVVKDANGEPRGVTVDLAVELAKKLGVPVEFMLAANSGLVTDATESGAIDVGFMPVDEERKKRVDFGPAYFMIESTYLATAGSGIKTVAEVDRPNVRVVGIANTTTIRAAARSLKNTTISAADSVEEAMALLRAGKVDAFALSRDSLPPLAAQLSGSRIVDGCF
jgi:polar amino acid transport system substrate-binding protein